MQNNIIDNIFVRIVILNYNGSQFTISLIEQLRKQSFINFEICVVDNASAPHEVKKLKNNLSSDIISIYCDKNLGYAGGNNVGMRYEEKTPVDYFLILNNDIIIEDADFIKIMVHSMTEYKSKNIVASSPLINTISTGIPLEEQIQVRRLLGKWETFLINIPLFKFYTNFSLKSKFLYREDMPFIGKETICDTINGATFIIEGDFARKNNYLDEGTFLYYEEIILGRQIKNSGKTCLLNGLTIIQHLQGISTKSSPKSINVKMEKFKYQSSLYYLRKYDGLGFIGSYIYKGLNEILIFLKRLKSFL